MSPGEEEDEEVSTTSLEEPLIIPTPYKSLCSITVEPILLSLFFCSSLTGSVTVNYLEMKTCKQDLHWNNCSEPFSQEVESLVQPKTAHTLMYMSLIQAVIPSLLSFFVGPWSDTNGRKPFIVISLAGYTLYYSLWAVLTAFPDLRIEYFLLPSVVLACSGGLVAMFTCVYSYIGDISTIENRAFRFTMVTSSCMFGIMAGYLTSAELVDRIGPDSYLAIYSIASGLCFVSLVYTLLLVPETIRRTADEREMFFNFDHVKNMVIVVLEKRPGHGRLLILMMAVILFILIILFEGEASVKYMALKEAFSWDLKKYNIFAAASTLICVFTSVIGISVLRRLLKVPDMVISVASMTIWLVSSVLLGFTTNQTRFWIYSALGSFAGLIGPTLRSEMSKIIPRNDLGKVFAFDSALESLSPYAAAPLYTLVYTAVLEKMPLAVYLLSALLLFIGVLLLLGIMAIQFYCGKPYCVTIEEEERNTNYINETIERDR